MRWLTATIGFSIAVGALIDAAPTVSLDVGSAAAPLVAPAPNPEPVPMLRGRKLEVPVEGIDAEDLRDTFLAARGRTRAHRAIDIMAPRHAPVRAIDDGVIVKLETSAAGGTTLYQLDASGNFCFYYAHLEAYAPGLLEGQRVERGQTIGFVGSSGNASRPHLHFAIFRLPPDGRWWKGEPINPYAVFR